MSALEIIPLVMSIVTFIGAAITYWRGKIQKQYAAERALTHIRNDIGSMSNNIAGELKELDHRLSEIEGDMKELKATLSVCLRGDGNQSGFFGSRR